MSKQTGLGWTTLSIDNSAGTPVACKNDITNLTFSTPRAVQDVTGIDKFAIERLLLLADFQITINGPWDSTTATTNIHGVLKDVSSTSAPRTTTIVVNSATLPNEVLFTDYALTRAQTGEFTWSAPGVLADGTVPTWS